MSGGDFTLVGGFWVGNSVDIEPECSISGDINCDGEVDSEDIFILLAAWGECARLCGLRS